MKEIWKDIPDYVGWYQVSNKGRVKNNKTSRILKQHLNKRTGYYGLSLSKTGNTKQKQVHVLVSMAFLGHIPNGRKIVINHKNFIKTDNRVTNLEITSQRENTNKKHIKSTSQYTGVTLRKTTNRWQSYITINGKINHLGYFDSEEEAHLAYQNKLKEINSNKY